MCMCVYACMCVCGWVCGCRCECVEACETHAFTTMNIYKGMEYFVPTTNDMSVSDYTPSDLKQGQAKFVAQNNVLLSRIKCDRAYFNLQHAMDDFDPLNL